MINWKKTKLKIPSSFKIKGRTWEVLWVNEFLDQKTLGESRFNQHQIVLLNSMSPKLTVHTFVHELFHVLSHETDANLTENQVLSLEKSTPYLLSLFWNLKE